MKRRTVLHAMIAAPVAAVVPSMPRLPYSKPMIRMVGLAAAAMNAQAVPQVGRIYWSVLQDPESWDFYGGDQWTAEELEKIQG